MKKNILTLVSISILLLIFACSNNQKEIKIEKETNTTEKIDDNTILVYYFHGSIRCHTCVSVDENTHQYLSELFPDKIKNGDIIFKTFNIDENEGEDLINKYEIYGQTLLFIKGDKVINETDAAFQYVTTKPDKWKQIVEDRIYDLLN